MARRVCVAISDRFIAELITTGKYNDGHVVDKGIPAGAVLVVVGRDPFDGNLILTYEHESFDDISEGDMYPRRVVQCSRINYRGMAEFLMDQLNHSDPLKHWKTAPGARALFPEEFEEEEKEDGETRLRRLSARLREH